MHLIMYLRKSREEVEREKETGEDILEAHRSRLTRWCLENNHTFKEFSEIGSGDTIANRPEFSNIMDNEIPTGKYQGFIITEVSRLGRGDMEDAGRIIKTCLGYNLKIFTPFREYNLKNQSDYRYIRFELFLAREEFELTKERLMNGKNYWVQKDRAVNNLATLGIESIRGKIIVIPNEAELVKEIFLMRSNGMSYQEIANIMNERNLITKKGTKYHQSTIAKICKNARYIGKNKWRKQLFDSPSSKILDIELWNKVQEVNKSRTKSLNHAKSNIYLVKLFCHECGNRMYGEYDVSRRGDKIYKTYYIYNCIGRKKATPKCSNRIYMDVIHEKICHELYNMLNNQFIVNELIEQRKGFLKLDTKNITEEIRELQKRINQTNLVLTRLDEDYFSGQIRGENYTKLYDKASAEIVSFREKIKNYKQVMESASKVDNPEDIIEWAKSVLNDWDNVPNIEKKKLINSFFPRIECDKSGDLYISRSLPMSI